MQLLGEAPQLLVAPEVDPKTPQEDIDRLVRLAARQQRIVVHFCGWTLDSLSLAQMKDALDRNAWERVEKLLDLYMSKENPDLKMKDVAEKAKAQITRGSVD